VGNLTGDGAPEMADIRKWNYRMSVAFGLALRRFGKK
jgi:hypothetical protein